MTKISEQVAELVEMVRDDAAGSDPKLAATAVVRDVPDRVIRYLAAEYLAEAVRAAVRRDTLRQERTSMALLPDAALEAVGVAGGTVRNLPRKGTDERAEWETCTLEGREYVRREAEIHDRFLDDQFRMVNHFVESMHAEWTAELLASTFALADGSLVTWGEASIDQHEQRKAMFERHIQVNAEGAARHAHAIATIRSADAACLSDAVRESVRA